MPAVGCARAPRRLSYFGNVSVDRNEYLDEATGLTIFDIDILLDGKLRVADCVEADDERGFIRVFDFNSLRKGMDHYPTKVFFGAVEIRPKHDWS